VRFTSDSPFPLGSIPKQFTATAILMLQEQGRLSVSDPISKFLPQTPADKRSITLHHLLTHTAGMPTYSGPDAELITRDTLVARMMRVKLVASPGEKFHYSNPGYSLLAVIIELVSGLPYETYVSDNIFRPLGMLHTSSSVAAWPTSVLPMGYLGENSEPYYRSGGSGRFPSGALSWNLVGNSGMVSTAQDMLKWAKAWDIGAILSEPSRRLATTRHAAWGADSTRFYGYGWILDAPAGVRRAWHSGGDGVIATYVTRYLDLGFTTVSFTNHSRGPSQFVSPAVSAALAGGALPELPSARRALGEATLRRYPGDYLLPSGDTLRVTVLNGQIVIPNDRPGGARAVTCFPPLADSSLVSDLGARLETIFAGLARGDLDPLLAVIWPEGTSPAEEREYWTRTWPEWIKRYGAYRRVEILGSRPGTSPLRPGVPLIHTYALVRFERGQYLVMVMQDPERRLFFDTSTSWLLQPRYYYVPQSETSFETFNFMLKTTSPLEFEIGSNGEAVGLLVGCSGPMRARRVDR
jgi:CubicO group peptidase (beta-lactamase class C family)